MPHYTPGLKPARWSWRKAVAFVIALAVLLWAAIVAIAIYIGVGANK